MKNFFAVREELLVLASAARRTGQEACGILTAESTGDWTVWPLPNAQPLPAGFLVDPVALQQTLMACEARGARLAAFWHSHSGPTALPSSADRYAAWKGVPFYICAPAAERPLRAWLWNEAAAGEILSAGFFSETPVEGEDTATGPS